MITDSSPSKDFGPRDGRTLKVVRVARASATDPSSRSVDAQLATIEGYVKSHYSAEIEFIDIASQGCGTHSDRERLAELEREIEVGAVDLVVCEDLARICRGRRAYNFCEMCVYFDIRLIAINDRVDTAATNWADDCLFAAWHHQHFNRYAAEARNDSIASTDND